MGLEAPTLPAGRLDNRKKLVFRASLSNICHEASSNFGLYTAAIVMIISLVLVKISGAGSQKLLGDS
jgi:hypothetical protein